MTFRMKRKFTGRDMIAVLVCGFAIVVAVNFTMAALATRGFGGVVVKNSYVASQNYNSWLEAAARENALGWSATVERDDGGHLLVTTQGVPEGALARAALRRPLGAREYMALQFAEQGSGRLRSIERPASGRWIVRLTISAEGDSWSQESTIQ